MLILFTLLSSFYTYVTLFILGLLFSARMRKMCILRVNKLFVRIFTYAAYISLNDTNISAYSEYRCTYGNLSSTDSHLSYLAMISDYGLLQDAAETVDSYGIYNQLKMFAVSVFLTSCQVSREMFCSSRELPERHRARLRFCSG